MVRKSSDVCGDRLKNVPHWISAAADYFGVRVRVWVVASSTAALVKGRVKVVPWYQAGH